MLIRLNSYLCFVKTKLEKYNTYSNGNIILTFYICSLVVFILFCILYIIVCIKIQFKQNILVLGYKNFLPPINFLTILRVAKCVSVVFHGLFLPTFIYHHKLFF
jgi:hypothetical protein